MPDEAALLQMIRMLPLVEAIHKESRIAVSGGGGSGAADYCVRRVNAHIQKVVDLVGDDLLEGMNVLPDEAATDDQKMEQVVMAASELRAYLKQRIGVSLQVEAPRRRSRFLNYLSEMRIPMNAIIGFTRVVLRRTGDILPDRQTENLNKVLHSAERLLNLINDLVDFYRMDEGAMEVQLARFEVSGLIAGCCATVAASAASDVTPTFEVSDDVGEVYTDEVRLRQVLINLLSNAVKFTEQGEVAVRATRERDSVVISVADTGPGIPADALDSIFEEFQQVKASDSQHKGVGLGMSITKGLVELLGGSIRVQSEVGKGSTFTLRIPVVYGEA